MNDQPIRCIHCGLIVVLVWINDGGRQDWVHMDGFQRCPITYATPDRTNEP